MANSILITGASGLIGTRLTELLLQKGCRVSHLGRSKKKGAVPSFTWDINRGLIEPGSFDGVDCIIHLAGAGIAEKRWTKARKEEIINSRVKSTALLHDYLHGNKHEVRTFVSASAIGYYGFARPDSVLDEASGSGTDFLARVVVRWEQEADRLSSLGIRLVKIRTGIVLSKDGGALKEIARPIRWGVGAALGRGDQIVSWIHLDDLCGIFMMAAQHENMVGIYNATAPSPVTNSELTASIAKLLHRRILLPNIPSVALRLLVGEMADLVLFGANISSRKIVERGYAFRFPEIGGALLDALRGQS